MTARSVADYGARNVLCGKATLHIELADGGELCRGFVVFYFYLTLV